MQPLSRPSAVLSSKEETLNFLLNTHRNGEFSMAMFGYRSVTLEIPQTSQLWSLQTPKNLGPQNGVQHPRIPYKKLIKIHVSFGVKKTGKQKNSLQSKTLKPFGLFQRMAQKTPLLFFVAHLVQQEQ